MEDLNMNGFHGEELEIIGENFHSNVLSTLNSLRQGQKFCDVTLVVERHDVPAHKCILVACSPFLFDLFTIDEENGVTRSSCKLREVSHKGFQYLLDYMYTGRILIRSEDVKLVYVTARKLKMDEVALKCVAYLANNLTSINCLGIRSYAQDEEMKVKVDNYIKSDINKVIVSPNFFSLPNLQIEIVGRKEDVTDSEQISHLLDLVLIWAQNNLQGKKNKLDRLTEQMNLLYLTRDNTLQDCQEFEDEELKEDDGIQDYRKLKRKQNGERNLTENNNNNNKIISNSSLPFQKFSLIKDENIEREWKIIAYKQTADNTYMGIAILNSCLVTISLRYRVAQQSPSTSVSDLSESPTNSTSTDPQYDRSRSLIPLNTMSTPRCGFGLRSVNGKLIACGGYDRGECLKSTECFNLESNTWTMLADMKTTRGRFSAARVGDTIFACGGSDGYHELRTVEVYDVEKDVWSFVAPMIKHRSSPGVAVLGDQLFCIGGCMGQNSVAECEVYDAKTDSWSFIASLNTARYQASVRAYNGKLYVMGGTDGWNCLNSVEVYDPAINEWRYLESLNVCRRGAGVECFQGKLYVIGGNDGTHSLKSTEIFDVENQKWIFGPVLVSPRSNIGSAVLDGRLFAVGGFNGKKFLDTMEYLDDANEWTFYTPFYKTRGINGGLSSSCDSLDNSNNNSALVMDGPLH
ncbi:hypothetical protein LOTGIDRAFT_237773 [Lottia gigantea]|uniref:BTB domain-containing protein n=1 Tax=Lottia gigantea TaxID=225164 RepID=V4CLR0_LOTGI|nr:hypothetical protein LOTGIDRAFT_237773 [Lottia gigantea]ESP03245.1 hypothetical protein LOTGIDRAFT_237773 [Lottia gigantea]